MSRCFSLAGMRRLLQIDFFVMVIAQIGEGQSKQSASWGKPTSGKEGRSKMKSSSPAKLEASPNGKESLQGQCRLQATHLRREWKKDTR